MGRLMTHQRWMELTYGGMTSRRSSALKKVDDALKRFHAGQGAQSEVKEALLAWMRGKPNWKASVRNKNKACETLYLQVHGYTGMDRFRSTSELAAHQTAMREAARLRAMALQQLFDGKQLRWKAGVSSKLANQKLGVTFGVVSGVRNARTLHNAQRGTAEQKARGMATKLMDLMVPTAIKTEVGQWLGTVIPDFARELAKSLTPFAGVITAGGGAVYSAAKAAHSQYKVVSDRDHSARAIVAGDPEDAVNAMIRMLERERNQNAYEATVGLAEFGGKLAGVLADGGTATNAAVGLAANVLKLTNIIRIVVRDVQEKNGANEMMRLGALNSDLFKTSPILGAYFVACSDTSTLIDMVHEEWATSGWMDQTEYLNSRHIIPLKERAKTLIKDGRFEIPELARHPGVLSVNAKALKQMRKNVGKTGMVGFGSDS